MLEISNVNVYDLKESVIASGYAMMVELPTHTEELFQKGLKRALKLSNAPSGSGHQTFLSGIRVSFDIKYPNYISPELQRYHFLDIVTSSSKMHRLCKMDMRKACNKYVDERLMDIEQECINKYNENPCYDNFIRMISNCPMGLELFMRCSTNYLQLKTIYSQRKHHRLEEDWGAFCEFIEKLPYAKEFIIGEQHG